MRPGILASALLIPMLACGRPEPAPTPEVPDAPPVASRGKLAAAHILVRWDGNDSGSGVVGRDRASALELAAELSRRARAGEDFSALAREYSDDRATAGKGGELGVFLPEQMYSAFSRATAGLHYGEISDPVASRDGYHVILRRPVEEIRVRHLVIAHVNSMQRPEAITRSEAEARALTEELRARALAGEDFQTLVQEYSDAPDRTQGGMLGPFSHGDMVEPFEDAAFALEVGAISEVIQTIYGFHLIRRLD